MFVLRYVVESVRVNIRKRLHIFAPMHIGKHIREIMRESGIGPTEFAAALHCHRQNVYKIFEKQNIDTALLLRISIVLKHNFFTDISAELEMCTQYGDSLQNRYTEK